MNREEYISILETDNASYKKENSKLQSNWNSLRELINDWIEDLENQRETIEGTDLFENHTLVILDDIKTHMNELEGNDKEVEIIEDKVIEKIGNDYYHKTQSEQNQIFKNKINELIDKVNILEKNK